MLFFDIYLGMFILVLSSYVIDAILYVDTVRDTSQNVGISGVEEGFVRYKTKRVEFIILFLLSLYCFLRKCDKM